MKMKIERAACFLFCALCALLAFFLLARYLLPILLPFALAYLFALATKGAADKAHAKTGIPSPILRVSLLVFFILLLFGAVFFFGFCAVREAEVLLTRFSEIDAAVGSLRSFFERFGADGMIGRAFDALIGEGTAFVFSLLSGVVRNALVSLPRALIFLVITLIAALYFALDLPRVSAFCTELLPSSYRARILRSAGVLKNCLLRYLRAYALLAALTFCALLVGFLLIGIRYAILMAALLTLLDLLPILGVGSALVPWGIFELSAGHGERGFALLLLFALIFLLRQFFEPKIVGKQMGLHPLASLFFTYAGLRLFGVLGMIFAPIAAAFIYTLWHENRREGNKKAP